MGVTRESGGITAGKALGNDNPSQDSVSPRTGVALDSNNPSADSVAKSQSAAALESTHPATETVVITNV